MEQFEHFGSPDKSLSNTITGENVSLGIIRRLGKVMYTTVFMQTE